MPKEVAELPEAIVTQCASAHVSSAPCVLLCVDVSDVLRDMADAQAEERRQLEEAERAMRAQRARDALKARINDARRKIVQLELRLGRSQRIPE